MHEHDILEKLDELLRKVDKIMGNTTALDAAVTQLTTDVGTLITQSDDQAAIDAATAQITTLDGQVQTAIGTPAETPPAT